MQYYVGMGALAWALFNLWSAMPIIMLSRASPMMRTAILKQLAPLPKTPKGRYKKIRF